MNSELLKNGGAMTSGHERGLRGNCQDEVNCRDGSVTMFAWAIFGLACIALGALIGAGVVWFVRG